MTALRKVAALAAFFLTAFPLVSDRDLPIAHAQEGNVDELIEFVQSRPSGMDRDTWRERRRDAARRLGESGDTRAVPVLIEVVETEDFDAIAEISVTALGKLGDERAVEILQEVAGDPSRDRFLRNAAKDALAALGADANSSENEDKGEDREDFSADIVGSENENALVDISPPNFAKDTIAAREELVFAIGDSSLAYDTVTKEAALDANLHSRYERIREWKTMATIYRMRADLTSAAVNFDGEDSSSRLMALGLGGDAEVRVYPKNSPWFAMGRASLQTGYDYLRVNRPGADNTTRESLLTADIGLVAAAGRGRVIDIGEKLRIDRMERFLASKKVLAKPIGQGIAQKLMAKWWTLRREFGFSRRLVATVEILREEGVLIAAPDMETSYGLLRILEDGQLARRPAGSRYLLGVAESLLLRDDDLGLEEGRIDTLIAEAEYATQSNDALEELIIGASARYRLLAEDGESSPYTALARANWRRYRYGDVMDPQGALDLSVEVGVSSDGLDDSELAHRVRASAGWRFIQTRASDLLVAADARVESGELFFGLRIEGRYGLVNAGYVTMPR